MPIGSSEQVCLYDSEFEALLCYNQEAATYKFETGLEINVATGDYTTPDGETSNFNDGPCIGDDFEEAEKGEGCRLERVTQKATDNDEEDDKSNDNDEGIAAGVAATESRLALVIMVGIGILAFI